MRYTAFLLPLHVLDRDLCFIHWNICLWSGYFPSNQIDVSCVCKKDLNYLGPKIFEAKPKDFTISLLMVLLQGCVQLDLDYNYYYWQPFVSSCKFLHINFNNILSIQYSRLISSRIQSVPAYTCSYSCFKKSKICQAVIVCSSSIILNFTDT